MSTTAEPLTAAATAASAVPAAPSSPASSGADGGAGADQGALLTDDAILGLEPSAESAPAGAQPSAAQPAATDKPAAPASAEPAQLTVEDFSPLFQQNPKVQSLWDRYASQSDVISKFGTLADAVKAAETVGMMGNVDALADLASKAADVDSTDAVFFAGTPEERTELVRNWYEGEGPHEFPVTSRAVREMVDVTLDAMRQRDPDSYLGLQDRITRSALTAERFPQYLANLAQALESGQGLDEAARMLLDRFGNQLDLLRDTTRQSPEAKRLAEESSRLQNERQTWMAQQSAAAVQQADTEIGTQATDMIGKALADLKLNGRPVFGEKSAKIRNVLAEQIRAHIDHALSGNRVFVAQMNSLKAAGLMGRQKELVDVAMRYVKLQLPASVQAVVGEWTEGIVSGAQGVAQRATAAASRKDIAGGSASPGSSKGQPPMTVAQMKEQNAKRRAEGKRPISEEEILGLPAT